MKEAIIRGIGGEGKGGQGVHDEVNPEELSSGEDGPGFRIGKGGDEGEDNGADVDSELELKELSDTIIDLTTPSTGSDDGGEVIVHEDDVSGLLSHLGPGNTHGEADIGHLEGGGIICPIPGHGHDLPKALEALDDDLLIQRGGPSEDLEARKDTHAFLGLKITEFMSGHAKTTSSVDTCANGDGLGSLHIVSGDHLDVDPGPTA